MIYGLDTEDQPAATAALLVYTVYRSRNLRRYKHTPDMWGQIERFCKASSKRARSIPEFLERFKPRLYCETISPRWMQVGLAGDPSLLARQNADGRYEFIERATPEQGREFMIGVINQADQREVLDRLYKQTAWTILLVRDRLEREKPIDQLFKDEEAATP